MKIIWQMDVNHTFVVTRVPKIVYPYTALITSFLFFEQNHGNAMVRSLLACIFVVKRIYRKLYKRHASSSTKIPFQSARLCFPASFITSIALASYVFHLSFTFPNLFFWFRLHKLLAFFVASLPQWLIGLKMLPLLFIFTCHMLKF